MKLSSMINNKMLPYYFNSYSVDVAYASRMKYVFKYFPTSDVWSLTGSSVNVTVDELHLTRNVYNASIVTETRNVQNLYYGGNYSNIETLAASSVGGYISDPITSKQFKWNGAVKFTLYPYYATYAPDLAG